jgi:hypothetical protein
MIDLHKKKFKAFAIIKAFAIKSQKKAKNAAAIFNRRSKYFGNWGG